jgi:hypothetical protein
MVDWNRVHKCDINDVNATFGFLKTEFIRHTFWNVEIIPELEEGVRFKGAVTLRSEVEERLIKAVAPLPSEIYPFDGMQTSMSQHNIILFAQHATATCCRKCMKYWYNVPYDRPLNKKEINYFSELIMCYVKERVKDL